MLGLVFYSRDLYLNQCKLHLEDGKGAYERRSELMYPSIHLEDGLTAMRWFMTRYTSIPLGLQRLYIRLPQVVLENNYVECDCLPDAYLQKIVTAMATSFSVTYATIFMILLGFLEVVGAKSNEQGRQLFLPCTMDASSPAQMHLVLCCCRNV